LFRDISIVTAKSHEEQVSHSFIASSAAVLFVTLMAATLRSQLMKGLGVAPHASCST
jgi:hypothetical protein